MSTQQSGSDSDSDQIFSALANPVRRRILERLLREPVPVNMLVDQLGGEFSIRRPAVSEHLQVLRNAGLVRDVRDGRTLRYHVQPDRLERIQFWLRPFERYWRGRMQALNDILTEEAEAAAQQDKEIENDNVNPT